MRDSWRRTFLAWSQERDYRCRVAAALDEVTRAISTHGRYYVAYSGGKDSTVLAHLARRIDPGIEVVCGTSGARHRDEVAEIAALASRQGIALRIVGFPDLRAYDLVFVGLRAEESGRRRRRIAARRYWAGVAESWPLADWTWLDVWSYIVEHDLPYLPIYDQLADVGIGYHRSRHHWAFGDAPAARALAAASDGVLRWHLRSVTKERSVS